ncbi:hypothetical protein ZWY2020_005918, partial [Hordeum vulgare]
SRTLHDGCATRTLNVIDTPGLFEVDTTPENVHTEIARCLDMTKDGIHAILMVFSATCRFSHEDEKTIESIKLLLGHKVLDHMILVFTHGDLVGKEITWKKKLIDSVISSNDGCPFSNQISRIQMSRMKKEMHDECLAQLAKMVQENPNSTITRLEKLLLEEQKARLESENEVGESLLRSEKEIQNLTEMLEKAKEESENSQKELEKSKKRVKTLEKKK